MTKRLSGSAYGVPAVFAVSSELVDEVRELLPPDWVPGDAPADAPRWEIASLATAGAQVNAAELYIAERAAGLIFIHAGAIVFGGAAILLPGRSFTGKSSLTDALVRAGGTYFSDEFAVLQPDGSVLPYARPLALRASNDAPARRIQPADMANVGSGPAAVGLIAALDYAAGGGWSAEERGAAEGTLALIDNAVAAQTRPAEVLAACAAAARNARFIRGLRGAADDAAQRLIELIVRHDR
jgi:hypothetical protein